MKNLLWAGWLVCSVAYSAVAQDTSEQAQTDNQEPEYVLVPLEEPIDLERGIYRSSSPDASYLTKADTCRYGKAYFGWTGCDGISNMVLGLSPAVDNILIGEPGSDGYVKFDDWESQDRDEEIESIWESLAEGLAYQGRQLGIEISVDNWLVYPTLDKENAVLYYATVQTWDGEKMVNIEASKFDRHGFVEFQIIPMDNEIESVQVKDIVDDILDGYQPRQGTDYSEFEPGDQVAEYGAIGALAALVGVKYAKAAVGFLPALLLLLKKFWFVLLIPFIFLKKQDLRKKGRRVALQ